MKLGDIKKACLAKKLIRILDCGGNGIWLSNGEAAWPVPDMGWNEKTVPEIFDLTAKERDSVLIQEGNDPAGNWCTLGPLPDEAPLWPVQPLGDTLILSTERMPQDGDAILVWQHNIRPARCKDEPTEFFLRKWGDGIVVVGYVGVEARVLTKTLSEDQVAAIQNNLRMLANMPIRPVGGRDEALSEEAE
jgi:hypothetical protein